MDTRQRTLRKLLLPAGLVALLAGCGGVKVWPFGEDKPAAVPGAPPGATLYQCEGNRRFYLRFEDKGATAWVIYPDREISLPKVAGGNRYSNGVAVLEFGGDAATLDDGPAVSYSGCKAAK